MRMSSVIMRMSSVKDIRMITEDIRMIMEVIRTITEDIRMTPIVMENIWLSWIYIMTHHVVIAMTMDIVMGKPRHQRQRGFSAGLEEV